MLYLFDDCVLDTDRRELCSGSGQVSIEPQAFDLLEYLIRHRERVVSRDELIDAIWSGRIVSESALNTRINAVRGAISDDGTRQRLIRTFQRKGIRFVGDVREESNPSKPGDAIEAIGPSRTGDKLPVRHVKERHPETRLRAMIGAAYALAHALPRAAFGGAALVALICFGAVSWSHFARSAQIERDKLNVDTAEKLTQISEHINMTSREDYEVARALRRWSVDLNPHNPTALARLTFAILTGVLNQWSDDVVGDLHEADVALQDAGRIAPENMIVRGAQCHILRAMRQFEAGIKVCSEIARSFPKYPFLHKEIGYNRLMLGQLDEALTEFAEADQIAPDSPLRWSWHQGIGLIYLMQGQDQKAIEELSLSALEAPNAGHPAAFLASAYALAGRTHEAHEALDHYLKLWPRTSLNNFGPIVGTAAFNSKMNRVRDGLRLAGLSDDADAPRR